MIELTMEKKYTRTLPIRNVIIYLTFKTLVGIGFSVVYDFDISSLDRVNIIL